MGEGALPLCVSYTPPAALSGKLRCAHSAKPKIQAPTPRTVFVHLRSSSVALLSPKKKFQSCLVEPSLHLHFKGKLHSMPPVALCSQLDSPIPIFTVSRSPSSFLAQPLPFGYSRWLSFKVNFRRFPSMQIPSFRDSVLSTATASFGFESVFFWRPLVGREFANHREPHSTFDDGPATPGQCLGADSVAGAAESHMTFLSNDHAGIGRCSLGAETSRSKAADRCQPQNSRPSHHDKPRGTHLPCMSVPSPRTRLGACRRLKEAAAFTTYTPFDLGEQEPTVL